MVSELNFNIFKQDSKAKFKSCLYVLLVKKNLKIFDKKDF